MKKCGNCTHYLKMKGPTWGVWRNGICGKYDYNVHSDSAIEGEFYLNIQGVWRCKGYKALRYSRH